MSQFELLKEEFFELGIVLNDDQYAFLNTNKFNTFLLVKNIKNIINVESIKFVKRRDVRLNYLLFLGALFIFAGSLLLKNMYLIVKILWIMVSIFFFFYSLQLKKYDYKIILITTSTDVIKVEVESFFKEEAKQVVSIIKKAKKRSIDTKLRYLK